MSTSSQPDAPAISSVAASPPRRFRYSVRTLVIFTAFVLLAISHLVTSFQLWMLRRDMHRMRGELGILDITDRTKVHAVAINDGRSGVWRWRVYVPPKKQVALCCFIGESKPGFYPRRRGGTNLGPGEHIVTTSLFQNRADQWRLAVAGMELGFPTNHVLGTPEAATTWTHCVRGKTVVMSQSEPMVLVRLVAKRMPPNQAAAFSNSESGDGFQVWLDETTFD